MNKKKDYNLEEVKKLWQQEPNDKNVFKAAYQEIDEYPPEIQVIIKEEAERRRIIQANTKPVPKETILEKVYSLFGFNAPKKIEDIESAISLIENAFGIVIGYLIISLVLGIFVTHGYAERSFILVESAIQSALAYGMHKKSRSCAIILFVYFVLVIISKLMFLERFNIYMAALLYILFGRQLFNAIRGTFAYHRLIKNK